MYPVVCRSLMYVMIIQVLQYQMGSNLENCFRPPQLTTLCAPHPSMGILNKAYSEVTLSGLQVLFPRVKSMAGEIGGSTRAAGTEKTKWWSIVHAGRRQWGYQRYTLFIFCHWQIVFHYKGPYECPFTHPAGASVVFRWKR